MLKPRGKSQGGFNLTKIEMLQYCLLTLPFYPLLICPWLWNFWDKCKLNREFLNIVSVPGSMFSAGNAIVIMTKTLPSGTFVLVGWPLLCFVLELPNQSPVFTGHAFFVHSFSKYLWSTY